MLHRLAVLVALGIVAAADTSVVAQGRVPREMDIAARHGWLLSLDAGLAEARTSGKPVMVVLRCIP
jgi:hypothetical protein